MYCLNVHSGETLDDVLNILRGSVSLVKERVSPNAPYKVGLRLSHVASVALRAPGKMKELRTTLEDSGLIVADINGFPYGAFQRHSVKGDVYLPDWFSRERLDYTMELAEVLAYLIEPGQSGTITTVPLCFGNPGGRGHGFLEEASRRLCALENRSGRRILLAVEPEPDCAAEDASTFFLAIPRETHLAVCIDTCHAAVVGEDPLEAFLRYESAGVTVGRIQISAALTSLAGSGITERLCPFLDDRFLHQTRCQGRRFGDLDEVVLKELEGLSGDVLVHFHVPIFWEGGAGLGTTRGNLTDEFLKRVNSCGIPLEIETYTYDVMPPALRGGSLVDDIVREELWLRRRIEAL